MPQGEEKANTECNQAMYVAEPDDGDMAVNSWENRIAAPPG